jgi:hypothetical protein
LNIGQLSPPGISIFDRLLWQFKKSKIKNGGKNTKLIKTAISWNFWNNKEILLKFLIKNLHDENEEKKILIINEKNF